MKNIAIICFGFSENQIRSQPWHMADGIATGLLNEGFNVELFTDSNDAPKRTYQIHSLRKLFHRRRPSTELIAQLENFQPDQTFSFIGSHELLVPYRFELPGDIYLVISNARFSVSELMRINLIDYWKERALLMRPLIGSMIPGWLLKRGYIKSGAKGVLYVSSAAQVRYSQLGLPKGLLLLPAVDQVYRHKQYIPMEDGDSERVICYFGPPLLLRGIDSAIEAFEVAAETASNIRLKLLLRLNGEAYVKKRYEDVIKRVESSKFYDRIEVIDKYMSASELKTELDRTSIFLLPFKLTVSDSPLVIIEAGLSGKPVLALNTPGVEEFVSVFGGVCASSVNDLGKGILMVLNKKPKVINYEVWGSWSQRVAPIIEALLYE